MLLLLYQIARAKRGLMAAQHTMIGRSFYCGDNRTDAAYSVGTDILLSLADLNLKVLKAGTWNMAP